ncbi:MAG: AAA family ATPase [Gemmatimonadaceae bacterium]|jgi:hypothetical protein|nr:AAA family ATPase [Gemmatimonadaceae bacterium]
MIERLQQHAVERALQRAPAVILTGPRQVGKSTLARRIAAGLGDRAVYLDLDADVDRRRLDDPTLFLDAQRGRLTVIDEIHRLPGLLQTLRVLIDARRRAGEGAGHFLLLGSASLDLLRQSGESLAGRAAYIELAPITPLELPEDTGLETLWARGGFPDSLLAATDADSFAWRRDFVR